MSDERTANGPEFTLARVFNAPRELVFKAWTEPERISQWWSPKGFEMRVCKVDLRPGGIFLYGMHSPGGQQIWGRFVYREIVVPERLVFVVSSSDEQGGVTRYPASETWPLEVLNTLTFSEDDGKTTLQISGTPINATQVERKTFDEGRSNMQQGFKGTLDQLEEYLAKAS